MVERIESTDGTLLALVIRNPLKALRRPRCLDANFTATEFYTKPEDQLQVGALLRQAGTEAKPHRHHPPLRTFGETAEVLVIVKGSARVSLFPSQGEPEHRLVEGGDVVVFLKGGHGVEWLEDSQVIEIKQGPYLEDKVPL